MKNRELLVKVTPKQAKIRLPHLGMRIVKTSLAVFICFIIYILRGYRGMVGESVIATIICMQPYVKDSREYAVNRVLGTFIGAVWGLLFLLLFYNFPQLGNNMVVVYGVMSIFTMLTLYSTVIMRQADAAGLAAIVFLCVVVSWPEIESPIAQCCSRVFDTLVGTLVAIVVNNCHWPRRKFKNMLFFVRTRDLVPDRFAQIPSTVMYGLNYFYNEGAKICLVSSHAPAFFISQMGTVNVNTPIIVSDGAAIYDMNKKEYLEITGIPHSTADEISRIFKDLGITYSVYGIKDDTMFIFHEHEYSEIEKSVVNLMKRSPYRNYIEGKYYEDAELTHFKIIDTDENINDLEKVMKNILPETEVRFVRRVQEGLQNTSALYIYSSKATIENAKKNVLKYIPEADNLKVYSIESQTEYRTERDAIAVLNRLRSYFAPIDFTVLFEKKKKQ